MEPRLDGLAEAASLDGVGLSCPLSVSPQVPPEVESAFLYHPFVLAIVGVAIGVLRNEELRPLTKEISCVERRATICRNVKAGHHVSSLESLHMLGF